MVAVTDQRFRSVIAVVLRGGVLVSGLLISAGFIGSLAGARILQKLSNNAVRWLFLPVLVVIALETLARGLGWSL